MAERDALDYAGRPGKGSGPISSQAHVKAIEVGTAEVDGLGFTPVLREAKGCVERHSLRIGNEDL